MTLSQRVRLNIGFLLMLGAVFLMDHIPGIVIGLMLGAAVGIFLSVLLPGFGLKNNRSKVEKDNNRNK